MTDVVTALCKYSAGPRAMNETALNMAVITESELAKLVNDWRATNPTIIAFWT